ncbi:MAG: hypothetical protein J5815_02105 [Clostridia bacterium]|nr:hypothetical protein [Clostridia bacterium]
MEEQKLDIRILNGTEIVVGKDLFSRLADKTSEVSKEGAILVLYDKNLKHFARDIGDNLRSLGRRIFLCEIDKDKNQDSTVPDYIRFIIAVGCGTIAKKADAISKGMGIPWSLFFTAPTTDTVLRGKSPKQVFIDTNVMDNCPKACIAAGYGIVYSRGLKLFESVFASKVLALEKPCVQFEIKGEINPVSLAMLLLEISAIDDEPDSADIVAEVLCQRAKAQGKTPRLYGEYKFVASSYLFSLYSRLVGAPAIDVIPPPSREDAAALLAEIGCDNLVNTSKSIDFFDVNSYFRISYIFAEYRTDLLEKLSAADVHKSQRVWRRIYDDAGYFLKDALTAKDVHDAVLLAGSVSENLLGYAYAMGALGG